MKTASPTIKIYDDVDLGSSRFIGASPIIVHRDVSQKDKIIKHREFDDW